MKVAPLFILYLPPEKCDRQTDEENRKPCQDKDIRINAGKSCVLQQQGLERVDGIRERVNRFRV